MVRVAVSSEQPTESSINSPVDFAKPSLTAVEDASRPQPDDTADRPVDSVYVHRRQKLLEWQTPAAIREQEQSAPPVPVIRSLEEAPTDSAEKRRQAIGHLLAREIGLQLDNHGHAHYESGVEVEAVEQPDGTVRQVAKRTKTGKPRSIRGRLMSRHELEMIAAHLDVIRDYQDERAAEYAAWHDAGRNILYGVEHERIWGRRVATIRDGTMQEKNTAATIPALPEQADHPKKQVQSQADGQDENTDQPPLVWKDDYIAAFLPPSMTREYYTPPPVPDQRPGFYRRHELGIKAAAVAGTLALAATMLGLTSANDEHAPPASHVHIETQPGPGAIQEPMPGYGEGRVGQRHVPSQGQKSKEQPRHHAASVVVPTSITLNGHEGDSLWSASARSITLNSEGLYKALGHQRADELLVRVTNQEMRDNGIPNERAAEHLPVNFSARISKQVKRIVRHFVHRFIKARARA